MTEAAASAQSVTGDDLPGTAVNDEADRTAVAAGDHDIVAPHEVDAAEVRITAMTQLPDNDAGRQHVVTAPFVAEVAVTASFAMAMSDKFDISSQGLGRDRSGCGPGGNGCGGTGGKQGGDGGRYDGVSHLDLRWSWFPGRTA